MYLVLTKFNDPVDGGTYEVGTLYPRKGAQPTAERIEYLCGDKNKLGKPVIERIEPYTPPAQKAAGKPKAPAKAQPKKETGTTDKE